MSLGRNIKKILESKNMSVNDLANKADMDPKIIHAIIRRNTRKSSYAYQIAKALNVNYEDLVENPYEKILNSNNFIVKDAAGERIGYEVIPSDEASKSDWSEIERWSAEGSCGGGRFNYDAELKKPLIKENSFFTKYQLKPSNAIAIYADGDSMADYIVDGDIVIFDRSKVTPVSGKIFLIRHPDGLRIKEIRKNLDGSIVLSSRNQNKLVYPDEVVSKENLGLLEILGQFVYRQGGF